MNKTIKQHIKHSLLDTIKSQCLTQKGAEDNNNQMSIIMKYAASA